MRDKISEKILKIIENSESPLETKEIFEKIKTDMDDVSRSKLVYRLSMLRGDGDVNGKSVGSGKGVWIWWKVDNISNPRPY